jgi:hypothetical protein
MCYRLESRAILTGAEETKGDGAEPFVYPAIG